MATRYGGKDYYEPKSRYEHSTEIIEGKVYCWGGYQKDIPADHDSKEKRLFLSVIEIFDIENGLWSRQTTSGHPPLGVSAYSSCTIRKNIYYFGGSCGHDICRHNSLSSLNVENLVFTELYETNELECAPVKKSSSGMISFQTKNNEESLLVVGGFYQQSPKYKQPGAQYTKWKTNESHIFNITTGKWITPIVTGRRPPPCCDFTLLSLSGSRVLLYGGSNPDTYCSDVIYIATITGYELNWEVIHKPVGEYPVGRSGHATTVISGCFQEIMITIGGLGEGWKTLNDCWVMDVKHNKYKKIHLPDNVTKRYVHSLSSFVISPTNVLLVVFGGSRGFVSNQISDTHVIELVWSDISQWSFGSVWSLDELNSHHQKRCYPFHRDVQKLTAQIELADLTRRKLMMTKEMELFEKESDIVSLNYAIRERDEKVNKLEWKLQLALSREESQLSDYDSISIEMKPEESKFKTESVLMIKEEEYVKSGCMKSEGNYEEHPVFHTVETKLVKEEFHQDVSHDTYDSQSKEYFQKENLIRSFFSARDNLLNFLKEEIVNVQDHKESVDDEVEKGFTRVLDPVMFQQITTVDTDEDMRKCVESADTIKYPKDVATQFNYLIPLRDYHSGVRIAAENLFVLQGDSSHFLNWEEYGIRINIQRGSIPPSESCEIGVQVLIGGQFSIPEGYEMVSGVYAISISSTLLKPLELQIQHCVNLTREDQTRYLSFVVSERRNPGQYNFELLNGGNFDHSTRYGKIYRSHFSETSIVKKQSPSPSTTSTATPAGEKTSKKESEDSVDEQPQSSTTLHTNRNGNDVEESLAKRHKCDLEGMDHTSQEKELEVDNETTNKEVMETVHLHSDSTATATPMEVVEVPVPDNSYCGQIYYQTKETNWWFMKFVVVQDLNHLKKLTEYLNDEKDETFTFCFKDGQNGYLELQFCDQQEKPCTGWTVTSHKRPVRLRKRDADSFSLDELPIPPSCLVTICATYRQDTVNLLNYDVPVKGTDGEVEEIRIVRKLQHEDINTSSLSHCSDTDPFSHICHCVLGIKDHSVVFNVSKQFSENWKYIGSSLGIELGILHAIKKDCDDVKEMMFEMIASWLKRESKEQPVPSWNILLTVLSEYDRTKTEQIASKFVCKHIQ